MLLCLCVRFRAGRLVDRWANPAGWRPTCPHHTTTTPPTHPPTTTPTTPTPPKPNTKPSTRAHHRRRLRAPDPGRPLRRAGSLLPRGRGDPPHRQRRRAAHRRRPARAGVCGAGRVAGGGYGDEREDAGRSPVQALPVTLAPGPGVEAIEEGATQDGRGHAGVGRARAGGGLWPGAAPGAADLHLSSWVSSGWVGRLYSGLV